MGQKQPVKQLYKIRTLASDQSGIEVSYDTKKEEGSLSSNVTKGSALNAEISKNFDEISKLDTADLISSPSKITEKKVIKEDIVVDDIVTPVRDIPTSKSKINIEISNEDSETATIITDTKKDRFKLFPAVFASIQKWFKDYKQNQKLKKIPKYTVPETTRRKGIIQKATSQTGKDATFDSENIKERIRQRQELEENKKELDATKDKALEDLTTINTKRIPEVPFAQKTPEIEFEEKTIKSNWETALEKKKPVSTTWTPKVEPVFPLLEKKLASVVEKKENKVEPTPYPFPTPNTKPSTVPIPVPVSAPKTSQVPAPVKAQAPQPNTTVSEIPFAKTSPTSKENVVKSADHSVISPDLPRKPAFEARPVLKKEPEIRVSGFSGFDRGNINNSPEPAENVKAPETIPAKVVVSQNIPKLAKVDYNNEVFINESKFGESRSLNLFAGIDTNSLALAIAVLIIILSGSWFYFSNNTSSEVTYEETTTVDPRLLNGQFRMLYETDITKKSLIELIKQEYKKPTTNISYFAFASTPEKQSFIKPSAILLLLDLNLETNFSQSVSNVFFGSLPDGKPFLIFNLSSYSTALGGMLNWENKMIDDLQNLLELNNTDIKGQFSDATLSGKDVRILRDAENKERLVYSIVDKKFIIITNDSASLGTLLESLTNN